MIIRSDGHPRFTFCKAGHTLNMGQRPLSMKGVRSMNQPALTPFPEDPALAMAYVRWQNANSLYEPEDAYPRGTIFPELDKPFYGRRARYGMQKRR